MFMKIELFVEANLTSKDNLKKPNKEVVNINSIIMLKCNV